MTLPTPEALPDEAVEAAARAFDAATAAHRGTSDDWTIYETWVATSKVGADRQSAIAKLADLRRERMIAMRAALTALAPWIGGEGWRDIESAPVGCFVLAWGEGGDRLMRLDDSGQWRNMMHAPRRQPKFWRPLPSPPARRKP